MKNPSVTDQVAEVVRWLEATQDLLQSAGFVTCAEHEAMAARLIATLAAEVKKGRACKCVGTANAVVEYENAIAATDALLAEVKRG